MARLRVYWGGRGTVTRAREWVRTFSDPAAMSDLREALRAMAGELDECDPEECLHPEQRIHPHEVYEWIEREVHRENGKPSRLVPAGRPGAHEAASVRRLGKQLNLSLAG